MLSAPGRYYRWSRCGTTACAVLPLGGTTVPRAVLPGSHKLKPPQQTCLVHLCPALASHVVCFSVSLCWCWSGDGSRRNPKRKAPGQLGSNFKKVAHKKKEPVKPISEISLPEYKAYREVNPYRSEQDPELVGSQFWNKSQRDVFNMILKRRKNKFVPHVKSVQTAAHAGSPRLLWRGICPMRAVWNSGYHLLQQAVRC